jgi:hypothetical protein
MSYPQADDYPLDEVFVVHDNNPEFCTCSKELDERLALLNQVDQDRHRVLRQEAVCCDGPRHLAIKLERRREMIITAHCLNFSFHTA